LNVVPNDATELIVRKGRVILSDSHTKVKGGNKVVFSATNVSVAKLTKEEKKVEEDVDNWSKERAETLAKANRKISDRMMTSAFASFRDWDPFSRGSGLWFYNRDARCYTFLRSTTAGARRTATPTRLRFIVPTLVLTRRAETMVGRSPAMETVRPALTAMAVEHRQAARRLVGTHARHVQSTHPYIGCPAPVLAVEFSARPSTSSRS
jgi:hypothetical protein